MSKPLSVYFLYTDMSSLLTHLLRYKNDDGDVSRLKT